MIPAAVHASKIEEMAQLLCMHARLKKSHLRYIDVHPFLANHAACVLTSS